MNTGPNWSCATCRKGPAPGWPPSSAIAPLFIRADVTSEADVAAAVDLAVSRFGWLDIMVNNAGIVGAVGPIQDTPSEAWRRTIAILLDGVFYGMKHAARVMTPRKKGSILSIASTAGVMGGLGPHAYTAAKARGSSA